MKRIVLSLLTVYVLIPFISAQNPYEYEIKGYINDTTYNGKVIYLSLKNPLDDFESNAFNTPPVDSALIQNSQFSFNGIGGNEGELFQISIPGSQISGILTGEPGRINLEFDFIINQIRYSAKGTPINDRMTEDLLEPMYHLLYLADSVMNKRKEGLTENNQTVFSPFISEMRDKNIRFIKEYTHYPIGQLYCVNMAFSFSEEITNELLPQLSEEARRVAEKNTAEKMQKLFPSHSISAGQQMIDFDHKSLTGETIRLSSLIQKHKLVLLDFWASWCGPCMRQVPELTRLYQQYREHGLEIIGISLDQSETEWKEAIATHTMNWIHFIDNDESRKISTEYDIMTIPHTFLIDSKGIIIGANLKGEKLKAVIKKGLEID